MRNLPTETIPDPPFRASLYFGELSSDYVIVRTRTREFHYPRGDRTSSRSMRGRRSRARIVRTPDHVCAAVRRSTRSRSTTTSPVRAASCSTEHRRARRRDRAVPHLRSRPVRCRAGRRPPVWIADAYTTTSRYPYATPAGAESTDIRNAVKDRDRPPTTATTTFYAADATDPILATYARAYSRHVQAARRDARGTAARAHPLSRRHGLAQASVFAIHHMTEPAVVLQPRDQWEVPTIDDSGDAAAAMQPHDYTSSCDCPVERR